MTAAGQNSKSSAWPYSESSGRASGSMMLTAVLEEQLKLEEEARVSAEDIESYPPTREENLIGSISYAEWTRSVEIGLRSDVNSRPTAIEEPHDPHKISFAAQDDLYRWNYVQQIGLPLADLRSRSQELQTIKPKADHSDRLKSTNRPGLSGQAGQIASIEDASGMIMLSNVKTF